MSDLSEIKHFHMCCGIGGGALGFNAATPSIGKLAASMRCIGGIDVDPAAIKNFSRLVGVPGTVMDLFDRAQYTAFWGREPDKGWCEATPADIRAAAGNERPNIVFISAPCKGVSPLLALAKAKSDKYQALNRLTLRCVFLMLEAWGDDPPEFIAFENVPGLARRGRALLDQIRQLLHSYGYAVAETKHNCGHIGNLAQSQERFLLVARHMNKVPAFLFEPDMHPLRPIGDVLGRLPVVGDLRAGPMHDVPNLQFLTWLKLALVRPGSDWRSLNDWPVEDGFLRDLVLVPNTRHNDFLGVLAWDKPAGTISGRGTPTNGAYSLADPRAMVSPPAGAIAIPDPRMWREVGKASFRSGGHYGVLPMHESCGTISVSACYDNRRFSVADTRLPDLTEKVVCYIQSTWKCWHRPFTLLEIAALMGFVSGDEEHPFWLEGVSTTRHREHLGNAVPPPAAQAIAHAMGLALLLSRTGQTFALGHTPIWVRPTALALAMSNNRSF